jgi:hypothetical protein
MSRSNEELTLRRGRPKMQRDDATTKIDRRLLSLAHLISADKGISTAEYLSELIRTAIEQETGELLLKRSQSITESE